MMHPLYSPARGWKDRQRSPEDRASLREVDPEREAIRRARAEMYAAEEEADRQAAEAVERALAEHRVSCPCCGSSDRPIAVHRAAAFLDAWDRYHLDGRTPDRKFVQAVSQTAWGREPDTWLPLVRVSYGAFKPISMGSVAGVVAPEPESMVATVEPPKPARGKKPVEDASVSFLLDGALVED